MSEARLIDADALREKVCGWFHPDPQESDDQDDIAASLCMEIDNAPTIDPVRHARWEAVNEHCNHAAVFRCSGRDGCGASVDYGHYTRFCEYEWCPNCGARMDAEGENNG